MAEFLQDDASHQLRELGCAPKAP